MMRFANDGGMIPEQIWDQADPTESTFIFGSGTGGAVHFDTNTRTALDNAADDGSFGLYRKTLTVPRVQQFSLRFSC